MRRAHATLPGVVLAFIVASTTLGGGRSLPVLLTGAAITAALAVLAVQWIKDRTRLPEDTAIASVLSVAYGLGMVLLSVAQTMPQGGQAGLEKFLLGATAGMLLSEAQLIAGCALLIALAAVLLFKELKLAAFDPGFAKAAGFSVRRLDMRADGAWSWRWW